MEVSAYCKILVLFPWDSVNPDEIGPAIVLILGWEGYVSERVEAEEEKKEETTKYLFSSAWCVGKAWISELKCRFSCSNFPLPWELLVGPEARLPRLVPILAEWLASLQNLGQLPKTLWASVSSLHNGESNRTFLRELWGLNEPNPRVS